MFPTLHRSHASARRRLRLMLEELESRTLFSASPLDNLTAAPLVTTDTVSQVSPSVDPLRQTGGSGSRITNPNPVGFQPSQIQTAYGFNQIPGIDYSGKNGPLPGTGQTIAIVDAYNDPNIKSDLAAFDAKFGLPAANLTVAMPQGTPLTNSGWSGEISLDVEWAHAMAPGAKILLVEARTNSLNNLLGAVDYAAQRANVVSMSWGGSEFTSETAYDSHFKVPGVTFVASAGDQGAPASWPAVSPNVVAVGGTTLSLDSSNNIASETGWSGSGGGISPYEVDSYQTGTSAARTNPDVAYNADPNTGFAIYDTVPYYGQTGWFDVGGTSAGAPQWSALVAIANQARAAQSESPLTGSTQTLPALYNMSASDFHDITSGNNGYSAGTGYDLVTGRGTPYANLVVQALVSAGSTGQVATGLAVTSNSSTSTSSTASASVVVFSANPAPVSGVTVVVTVSPASAPVALAHLASSTPSGAESLSTPSLASLADVAFRTSPTSAASSTNALGQAPSSASAMPGFQLYASRSNAAAIPSMAFRASLGLPGEEGEAGEGVMDGSAAVALRVSSPRMISGTLRGGAEEDIDLAVPPTAGDASEGDAAAAVCDACFADPASLAVFERSMALAAGDNEDSLQLRGPSLALMALLLGCVWKEPTPAGEAEERRERLVVELVNKK